MVAELVGDILADLPDVLLLSLLLPLLSVHLGLAVARHSTPVVVVLAVVPKVQYR